MESDAIPAEGLPFELTLTDTSTGGDFDGFRQASVAGGEYLADLSGVVKNNLPSSGVISGPLSIDILVQSGEVSGGTANDTSNIVFELTLSFAEEADTKEFRWTTANGGSFEQPENWDPEQVPVHDSDRSDTAVFGSLLDDAFNPVAAYAVSASGATAGRFIIDGTTLNLDGTAQVSGPSSTEPSLAIIRSGRLILDNAARLSGVHASVGFNPGFPAALAGLEISGAGSDYSLSGRLIIGEFSGGELFLANGATLSCGPAIIGDIAAGQALVSGVDARWDADSLTLGAVSADGALEVLEAGRVEVVNQLVVGDLSTGTLRLIDGGRVVAGEVVIGQQVSNVGRGAGSVELNGDDGEQASLLEVSGALRVGVAGDATLVISDGSSVRAQTLLLAPTPTQPGVAAGASQVIVRGTDFESAVSDLTVFTPATLSNGRLEIFNGARANFADLALGAGGATEVEVAGFGDLDDSLRSTLTASRLTVGFDDSASINVSESGLVECNELSVNSLATGGVGRILVTGGAILVDGLMRVSGDFQSGENVVIDADGILTVGGLRLGDESSADPAELVVRNGTPNGGSSFIVLNGESNAECSIGQDGPGTLRFENRGNGLVTGSARVGGSAAGGAGLVEIGADCGFSVGRDLDVGGASPGTIKLLADSATLTVGGSAVVNAGGRVEGIGTFNGPRFRNPGGFVSPGLSPGTLTIEGDYEQGEEGTLIIEVAGIEPGQFDALNVTDHVSLGGTLEVRFLDGFLPRAGDSVDFLQVGGTISGQFAQVSFPELADGFQADLTPTDDARLRLTARTDAVAGSGTTITPVQDATAPPGCGAGACGAGLASTLGFTLGGLTLMRRWRSRASH